MTPAAPVVGSNQGHPDKRSTVSDCYRYSMVSRLALVGTLLAVSSCEGLSFGVEPVDFDGRCEHVSEDGSGSTPIVVGEALQFRFYVYDAFWGEDPPHSPVGVDGVSSSDPTVVRIEQSGRDDEGFHRIRVVGVAPGRASIEAENEDDQTVSIPVVVVESDEELRFADDSEGCASSEDPGSMTR